LGCPLPSTGCGVRPLGEIEDRANFQRTTKLVSEYLGINLIPADISAVQKQLIEQREAAREAKDYTEADRLRATLKDQSIELKDTPYGPRWQWILKAAS
jgi:cysteinyl-tRNA synthetase